MKRKFLMAVLVGMLAISSVGTPRTVTPNWFCTLILMDVYCSM